MRSYDLDTILGRQQAVNDLVDRGVLNLTELILEAMEARINANLIAENKENAKKASRIAQIYRDAVKRIEII